jgi:hypothetical protein
MRVNNKKIFSRARYAAAEAFCWDPMFAGKATRVM